MGTAALNRSVTNMNSDQVQIEHSQTPAHGEFTIGRDAIMTYRKLGDRHIEVNHTRVAREAQGQASLPRDGRICALAGSESHAHVQLCRQDVRALSRGQGPSRRRIIGRVIDRGQSPAPRLPLSCVR